MCPPPGSGGGRGPYHVRPPGALTSAPRIWGRTFSVKRPFFVRPRPRGADVLPVGGGRNTYIYVCMLLLHVYVPLQFCGTVVLVVVAVDVDVVVVVVVVVVGVVVVVVVCKLAVG